MGDSTRFVEMIELSEVLQALREELTTAQATADSERVQFGVGPVQITLSVAVTKDAKVGTEAGGRILFWVVNADVKATGSAGVSTTATQTISLTLTPYDSAQPVANGSPGQLWVAGSRLLGED